MNPNNLFINTKVSLWNTFLIQDHTLARPTFQQRRALCHQYVCDSDIKIETLQSDKFCSNLFRNYEDFVAHCSIRTRLHEIRSKVPYLLSYLDNLIVNS